MAAVYKSLSSSKVTATRDEAKNSIGPRNRQRVLILSSRGVTYRYETALPVLQIGLIGSKLTFQLGTDILWATYTRCYLIAGKSQN
jgi:ribosome biogenesis protein BRX1